MEFGFAERKVTAHDCTDPALGWAHLDLACSAAASSLRLCPCLSPESCHETKSSGEHESESVVTCTSFSHSDKLIFGPFVLGKTWDRAPETLLSGFNRYRLVQGYNWLLKCPKGTRND